MSIAQSHLNSAIAIVEQYTGAEPFASFLRKHFSQNKKFGSKDRKEIAHLCYCYFRLGKAFSEMPTRQRVVTALFLCSTTPDLLLNKLMPEWGEKVLHPLPVKLALIEGADELSNIFPWKEKLSAGIDHLAYCQSFLIQPDLFLRIRPGKEDQVLLKLKQASVIFSRPNENCISLNNKTKIDDLIILDKEAVVQDCNSQRTGDAFTFLPAKNIRRVWDCCAASGGKSIMAVDSLGDIELTVSDIRKRILINLENRFLSAGIKKFRSLVADLSVSGLPDANDMFDLVIADVPCSGSGTWSRTPEQLYYFKEEWIDEYASLQKKILSNVIKHVKPGGYLLYITCSVFKAENEEMITWLLKKEKWKLVKMEMLKGYFIKADSMFMALLQKTLQPDYFRGAY